MNPTTPLRFLGAEAYGTGTYDCGDFQEGCVAGTGTADNGLLVNTGYPVLIPVAIAAALIISAVIVLVTRFVRTRRASRV